MSDQGSASEISTTQPEIFQLLLKPTDQQPEWFRIATNLREDAPEQASYRDTETGLTALHLAVSAARTTKSTATDMNANVDGRRNVIKTLLALYPESTSLRCRKFGFTPLAYACFLANTDNDGQDDKDRLLEEQLQENAKVVEMLLMANPKAMNILSKSGISPLALHIQCVSSRLLHKSYISMTAWSSFQSSLVKDNNQVASGSECEEEKDESASSSTYFSAVLEVLARHCSRTHLEAALETLYKCNTLLVMNMFTKQQEVLLAHRRNNILTFGRPTTIDGTSVITDIWLWQWVLLILRHISIREQSIVVRNSNSSSDHQGITVSFRALHVASQFKGFPTPLLLIAMRAYPTDVPTADRKTGNLPLHSIASWRCRHNKPEGNTDNCRKSMSLTSMASEYPPAMGFKNKRGKTPLELMEAADVSS